VEVIIVAGALCLGYGTSQVAKRYNRDPLPWGIFGALLFILALPMLLMVGPLPAGRGQDAARRRSVEQRRHLAAGGHLPGTAANRPETGLVLDVLEDVDEADFDTLMQLTGLNEDELAETIDAMLGDELLATSKTGFALPDREVAPTAAPLAPNGAAAGEVADRLRRLQALHDDGLLDDEEYDRKRRAIIDQL
jgi:hypothetical protein